MFESLAGARWVIVTGPHRSGTTIASEIIAARLGYRAVREREIAAPRFAGDDCPYLDAEMVERWLGENERVVLQGATCFRWVERLQRPGLATVCVWRSYPEILRSQIAYRGNPIDDPLGKYERWRGLVAGGRITLPLMIAYDDLAGEPEFVADRRGWRPRQTR